MRHGGVWAILVVLTILVLVVETQWAESSASKEVKVTTEQVINDPFMGEYVGTYTPVGGPALKAEAKVFPQGDGTYRMVLSAEPARKGEEGLRLALSGKVEGDKLPLVGKADDVEWEGTLVAHKLSVKVTGAQAGTVELVFMLRKSPTEGLKPPADAVVLLPLTDGPPPLDEWTNKRWARLPEGSVEIAKGGNRTVKEFGDIRLLLEFRTPYQPSKRGQGRGNSGVYLQNRYEIQVLDSFGLVPRKNECGALYGVAAPLVNASLPPLAWQTYDMVFRAPRLSSEGQVVKQGTITVFHNGVKIHDRQPLPTRKSGEGRGPVQMGPLMLQDHGNPVRYRNIWVVELKDEPGVKSNELNWPLGVQAYSFRKFTFYEAIEKTASLGLHYIEAYPGQRLSKEKPGVRTNHKMPDEIMEEIKKKLQAANIKLINYGVVGLGNNEARCRQVFEFAKKMGIETIVSEPPAEALGMLDRLCNEYGINVAIHNHPKPSRYWNPKTVLAACEGKSSRIGACADTGHWMRSGVDPLEALKMLKGRIVSLHFKDLNKSGSGAHDVPWGTGAGNVQAMLAEIHRQGIRPAFSIEYEYNWDNSVPEIARCVEYFNSVVAELAGSKPKR